MRDSDAVLILTRPGVVSSGTEATVRAAEELGRPYLVAEPDDVDGVQRWLAGLPRPLTLDVAGPRESQAPGIAAEVRRLLEALDL